MPKRTLIHSYDYDDGKYTAVKMYVQKLAGDLLLTIYADSGNGMRPTEAFMIPKLAIPALKKFLNRRKPMKR